MTCSALSPQNVTSPSLLYEQSSTSKQHIQNDKTNRYHDNDDDNNHNTDQKLDDVIKKPWSQYQSLLNLEQILRRLYRTSTPPVDMTRTSSQGTVFVEEQSTSSVEKISSGGDESTSSEEQKPSFQEGSEGGTKDPEAPGGEQQKWMYESLKGMEDITVEKGETTGKQIYRQCKQIYTYVNKFSGNECKFTSSVFFTSKAFDVKFLYLRSNLKRLNN